MYCPSCINHCMWSLVRVSGWQILISGFPGLWSKGCRLVAFIRFYAADLALKHLLQDTGRCRGACIHGRKVRLCLNARVVGLACIMRHTAHSTPVACSEANEFLLSAVSLREWCAFGGFVWTGYRAGLRLPACTHPLRTCQVVPQSRCSIDVCGISFA